MDDCSAVAGVLAMVTVATKTIAERESTRSTVYIAYRWKIGRYRFGIWRTMRDIAVAYAFPA